MVKILQYDNIIYGIPHDANLALKTKSKLQFKLNMI